MVLLDKDWAAKYHCKCFSGDSRPFYLSSKVEYRPDVVWETRNGTLYIVEIPNTEDQRAVVGEFFLACGIRNARYFTAIVNEGREWLKPYLAEAWKLLMQLTEGYEYPDNCPMFKPTLVVVPRKLGNSTKLIQKYLQRAWK